MIGREAKPNLLLFFFNDTATTEIYTLSLHDALPICRQRAPIRPRPVPKFLHRGRETRRDRKSTRLNSSHGYISYAVFCLKKKRWLPGRAPLGLLARCALRNPCASSASGFASKRVAA